LNSKEDFK
jgi:hypothetical protein